MKKKLLFISVLLMGLFLVTGCGKVPKETISLSDNTLKYKTTFEYDKEDGFGEVTKKKGGKFSEIEFKNEKENLEFDMYYTETTDVTARNVKDNRKKNQKYYKEYKFGEYDAYIYSNYGDDLYVVITLKEDMKENKTVDLFTSIETIKYNKDTVLFDEFNKNEVIKNFFKSIKNTVE